MAAVLEAAGVQTVLRGQVVCDVDPEERGRVSFSLVSVSLAKASRQENSRKDVVGAGSQECCMMGGGGYRSPGGLAP